MQTFLPLPDFVDTFLCLDYRRLGKQRVEARQILNILLNRTSTNGWRNHPAVKMWRGYEEALKLYFNLCCQEWICRGFKNTLEPEYYVPYKIIWPVWLGNPDFHAAHRSNLLRKNAEYYGRFGWTEDPSLPYIWPIN